MSTYRILSMDGGGIRGLITAILIQRLSQSPGLSGWLNQADLLAGTSTGGLLALGIAKGLDIAVIRDLYEKKGKKVFDDSWLDDVFDLGKVIGADYGLTGLKSELKAILGETKLKDLKTKVLITAFDLDNEDPDPSQRRWKPKLFHNFKSPSDPGDGDQMAWKVGVYTAAAPTYFPSFEGYIDGGVYATNPSMCALAQSQDVRLPNRPAFGDVVLLSLGTGTPLEHVRGQTLNWGYAQWAKPLVSLMLDGVAGIADYQCRQLLGDRYCRVGPVFPPDVKIPMDGVGKIREMIDFANSVDLKPAVAWLKANWI